MMRCYTWLLLGTLVLGAANCAIAAEEEGEGDTTVTQSQLPAKVVDAVKEYGKGGTFVKAVKTNEDGVLVYEVTLDARGKKVEVQTTLDGELNMREEVIEASQLPKAVTDRIMKDHPGAKIARVEKTVRTVYEIRVQDASGKKSEVLVTPGGLIAPAPEELEGGEKAEKGEKKEGKEEDESDEKEEKAAKSAKHPGGNSAAKPHGHSH